MAQRLHRGQGMTRALGLVAAILLLLPALPPLAVSAQGDCVSLEDFKKSRVGEFPADWKARKDAGQQVYTVAEEGGVVVLEPGEERSRLGDLLGVERRGVGAQLCADVESPRAPLGPCR